VGAGTAKRLFLNLRSSFVAKDDAGVKGAFCVKPKSPASAVVFLENGS
jgi:hypothetical protein